MKHYLLPVFLMVLLMNAVPSSAQNSKSDDEWHYRGNKYYSGEWHRNHNRWQHHHTGWRYFRHVEVDDEGFASKKRGEKEFECYRAWIKELRSEKKEYKAKTKEYQGKTFAAERKSRKAHKKAWKSDELESDHIANGHDERSERGFWW